MTTLTQKAIKFRDEIELEIGYNMEIYAMENNPVYLFDRHFHYGVQCQVAISDEGVIRQFYSKGNKSTANPDEIIELAEQLKKAVEEVKRVEGILSKYPK